MDACPTCEKPYGKRKRCYICQPGKRKTGETRACVVCGTSFYVQRNTANDVARHSGTYCSLACKHVGQAKTQSRPQVDGPTYHTAGYRMIWMPEHPRANRGRVLEHIVVAEKKIGRPIAADEHVHHLDGNKTNNDPDNLVVLSNAEHQQYHVHRLIEARRAQALQSKIAEYERRFGPLN